MIDQEFVETTGKGPIVYNPRPAGFQGSQEITGKNTKGFGTNPNAPTFLGKTI